MTERQLPQWLFAFDAALLATVRALAGVAADQHVQTSARAEATTGDPTTPRPLAYLRKCVLESLRLWPTTPAILREATAETTWANGTVPAGTTFVIFAPHLHRGPHVPAADEYRPERWLDHDAPARDATWVPFSAGPAECPGKHVVLLTTSTLLASILEQRGVDLVRPRHRDPNHLPGTLSPFRLRFRLRPA